MRGLVYIRDLRAGRYLRKDARRFCAARQWLPGRIFRTHNLEIILGRLRPCTIGVASLFAVLPRIAA
jgi:hypothetical protein